MRRKTVLSERGNILKTKYFFGSYEKTIFATGKEYEYHFLPGNALMVIADKQVKMYYLHKDHLGSILSVSNQLGNKVADQSFGAWGRQRNIATWTYNNAAPPETLRLILNDRGYTGHEMLPEFKLINMNGRLYDPILARMLSPDNYIQMPDFTQNFNRYSYVLNNPLVYTDPSGEFIFTALLGPVGTIIDAALWGAVIGGSTYTASVTFSNGGFNNWDWSNFGKSVGIGAISGAMTSGIGQIFGHVGNMGFGGEIIRAYTHGFGQGILSEFTGGDFLSGFASGSLGSLGGSAFMMYGGSFANSKLGFYAFSGLSGDIGAELSGGNFREGVTTGIMITGLNHLKSMVDKSGAKFFANKKAGYDYMWENSFIDDKPIREVSAWEIENNNIIVLPYDGNGIDYSHNNALKVSKMYKGKRYVKFNGKIYKITTHAHTHPVYRGDNIRLSGHNGDVWMYKYLKTPIHVLYNRNLYSCAYSSKGRWYWEKLGPW